MGHARTVALLALLAVLALSGCQVPGAEPGGGYEPTITVVNATGAESGTTIAVANGTLDPGRVFAQMQTVLGRDVAPPPRIRVVDDIDDFSVNVSTIQSPIRRHLNVTSRGDLDLGDQENGAVGVLGSITIYPGQARNRTSTEWVLAHEYVHYVQIRRDATTTMRTAVDMSTTDGRFVRRAMIEGPAVFATEHYLDRYAAEGTTTLALYRQVDRGLPPGSAGVHANRQYLLGYRYVVERFDDPASMWALYDHPPTTSEQVIHGYLPSEEPIGTLSVTVETTDAWSLTGTDRMGEAFLWTALEDRLGESRARAAAAGWGNDTLLTVYPTDEGNASFAWVVRWDDAANATEFERAARDYLDRAGSPAAGLVRLDSGAYAEFRAVDDRTTVLLVGDHRFVEDVSVSAGADGVTVEAGDVAG